MTGWQCYFVSNDQVVGCIGQTGLITRQLAKVETFSESGVWVAELAKSLLNGPHPLDHHSKVSYSIKWKD